MMNNKFESIRFISESTLKKLAHNPYMSDILSGKYRLEGKYYSGLYAHLFKDVKLDKKALSAFKGEYFLSGYEITEIHLEDLYELARYYQFGLKGHAQDYSKSALCYALLIQFSKPLTDVSTYFDALAYLFKTGGPFLEENVDLGRDFAISANIHAMTHKKIKIDNKEVIDLAKQLSQLSEKMDKKLRALLDLSPQNVLPAEFHKRLYLTVENCLDTKSIELRYSNVLDIINKLKIYLLKKNNVLKSKYKTAEAFIHERLKPINTQLDQLREEADAARKHVLDLYSIIHLNEKLPSVNHEKSLSFAVKDVEAVQLWYLSLKRKKSDLAVEIAQWTATLPERHGRAKNTREREAIQQEILSLSKKVDTLNEDIHAFQKVLEDRAIEHIAGQDLPWQNETFTQIEKNAFIKKHLDHHLIKPLKEGLPLLLRNASVRFNQLEVPFESGLNSLIQKTLQEVEHYELIIKSRTFVDTNYFLRNPSIEKVKAACIKANDTAYLASSRMEYLLTILVRERENTHIAHLYPFGRKSFWHECLAFVKRFFSSELEKGYQCILNDALLNQLRNDWHLPTFDFRKAYNKKPDCHQEIPSLTQGELHTTLIELFSKCKPNSSIHSIFKFKNPCAEEFIAFLKDNPKASDASIRAKIDNFVILNKSDTQFIKTSMEALHLLDASIVRTAIPSSVEI